MEKGFKIERITLEEAHHRMKAQGVSAPRHYAFKCPICKTVQSMASLVKAGVKPENAESYVGFSCEGRFSEVGSFHKPGRNPEARGCDWTLGGLFQLHTLEIDYGDGKIRPCFEIVSAEEAQALEKIMAEQANETAH